jgi:hypothetical protein
LNSSFINKKNITKYIFIKNKIFIFNNCVVQLIIEYKVYHTGIIIDNIEHAFKNQFNNIYDGCYIEKKPCETYINGQNINFLYI